ncbi:hypothetical protein [Nocardioides stalactiti]|uniref:hypothetical protein n=1 Tax=Nocardioides stalactiti TaxID=2755356 RepID=UPI0015FF5FE3|nr:hypothetical protein [Nocardioides stalactiti]
MLRPLLRAALLRARLTSRRGIALGALLACVATTGSVVGAGPSGAERPVARAAGADPLTGFTVQVGPEERVYGPTGLTDFPYFSERDSTGTLLGFISNNDSYRVSTTDNKSIKDPRMILERGQARTFDKCGAWLIGSVYKQTANTWVALYHAEGAGAGDDDRCVFSDDSVVASVGRAVSTDAGRTWRKTGQVLTQDDRMNGPKTEDATMGRLIRYGDYLYFYYAASNYGSVDTSRSLHVARSSVSDAGARGTWKKWHCYKPSALAAKRCDFGGTGNEGLGGESSPLKTIDPMARVIVPNTFLHRNVALYASGSRGFRLWISNTAAGVAPIDPANPASEGAWAGSVQIYPAVSTQHDPLVDTWNRTPKAKQLYAYPSIVATNGDSNTSGQTFYIYYVKLFPGGDFPERYLMRRLVTLVPASVSMNRVALTTYVRKSDGRRRTSTERPIQKSFKAKSSNVYVLSKHRNGWVDLFECVKKGDYRLRAKACATGERAYRRVGYVRPTAGDSASIPIYRCFNKRKGNHFASTSRRCEGAKREAKLGYGLPSV